MLFLDRGMQQLPHLWPQTWSHDSSGSSYIRSVCVSVCAETHTHSPQTVCTRSTNNKDDPCLLPIYTHFLFFYFYSILLSTLWVFLSADMKRKWNWQLWFYSCKCWLKRSEQQCQYTQYMHTQCTQYINYNTEGNKLNFVSLSLSYAFIHYFTGLQLSEENISCVQ